MELLSTLFENVSYMICTVFVSLLTVRRKGLEPTSPWRTWADEVRKPSMQFVRLDVLSVVVIH